MVVTWLAKNNEIKRESASVENKLMWLKWERKRDGYEHICLCMICFTLYS